MPPIDEDYARMLATAGGMITAGLAVADCMMNNIPTAALHLAVGLAALTTMRFVLWRSLRPARTPSPAPASDDTED